MTVPGETSGMLRCDMEVVSAWQSARLVSALPTGIVAAPLVGCKTLNCIEPPLTTSAKSLAGEFDILAVSRSTAAAGCSVLARSNDSTSWVSAAAVALADGEHAVATVTAMAARSRVLV